MKNIFNIILFNILVHLKLLFDDKLLIIQKNANSLVGICKLKEFFIFYTFNMKS